MEGILIRGFSFFFSSEHVHLGVDVCSDTFIGNLGPAVFVRVEDGFALKGVLMLGAVLLAVLCNFLRASLPEIADYGDQGPRE